MYTVKRAIRDYKHEAQYALEEYNRLVAEKAPENEIRIAKKQLDDYTRNLEELKQLDKQGVTDATAYNY